MVFAAGPPSLQTHAGAITAEEVWNVYSCSVDITGSQTLEPRWAQTRMAAPRVPVASVGVVWAGNGWGGKRLKAAGLTGGAVSTLGGGQQPVKCGIPDQWSPNNVIVRRKRPASVQGPVLGRCCLALNITARTRARRYFLMMNCKPVFPTSCHFKPV